MNKQTNTQGTKSAPSQKVAPPRVETSPPTNAKKETPNLDALLPPGSWQRVTLGVVAAAGGGLLAAALLGPAQVALAGAAGYLAYRGLRGQGKGLEQATSGDGNHAAQH